MIQKNKGRYRRIFLCEHYQWFSGTNDSTSWDANWKDFCDVHHVSLALSVNNHIYVRTHPVYHDQIVDNGQGMVYMQALSADGERGIEAGPLLNNTNKLAHVYSSHTRSGGKQVKTVGCILVQVNAEEITTRLVYLDDNKVAHVAGDYTIPATSEP